MKHVLGMAKRHLDLKGAKAQKLELDFLRLVYAVKELRRKGECAQGYLLVTEEAICKRVKEWQIKYDAGDAVVVEAACLTEEERRVIKEEAARNKAGMAAGTYGEDVDGRSDATFGGCLMERKLEEWIECQEPGVQLCNTKDPPLRIHWDYYGQRAMDRYG